MRAMEKTAVVKNQSSEVALNPPKAARRTTLIATVFRTTQMPEADNQNMVRRVPDSFFGCKPDSCKQVETVVAVKVIAVQDEEGEGSV